MPELPEVETVKSGIEKFIGNAQISEIKVRNCHLRIDLPADFVKICEGAQITRYARIGKYIVINLSNEKSIIWHLGMSGKIKTCTKLPQTFDKHDHIIIKTTNGYLIFNDPRRFGLLDVKNTDELPNASYFKKMGIDPFSDALTVEYIHQCFAGRKSDIKSALLDQHIIAGIGNIYASEILFAAGISPTRSANSLNIDECTLLIKKIREILKLAIDNGGSTLHDYLRPDGSLGYFQNLHCVYNKTGQRCPDCICQNMPDGGIRKITQGGRSTFYCPVKQK